MLFGERPGARHDGALLDGENLIQHRLQIHDWTCSATAG
jgi:hypothetical protein